MARGSGGGGGGGGGPGLPGFTTSEFPVREPVASLKPSLNYEARFPEASWDAWYFAQLALAEFATTEWREMDLGGLKPPDDRDDIFKEIEVLIGPSADKRRERSQEIFDQITKIADYFAHVLMLSPMQQNTIRAIEIADQAGLLVAMHFKRKMQRARPQQVFPGLVPLIPAPGHPSWPSGHALESHMIALALKEIVPDEGHRHAALDGLADRIGENREIAGVHFASDTRAGRDIAHKAFEYLKKCRIFVAVVKAAQAEHYRTGGA